MRRPFVALAAILLLLVSAGLTAVRNPLVRRRLFFADLLLVCLR